MGVLTDVRNREEPAFRNAAEGSIPTTCTPSRQASGRAKKDSFFLVCDGLKGPSDVVANVWPLTTVHTLAVHNSDSGTVPPPTCTVAGITGPCRHAVIAEIRSWRGTPTQPVNYRWRAIERSEGLLVERLHQLQIEIYCVSPKISARARECYRLATKSPTRSTRSSWPTPCAMKTLTGARCPPRPSAGADQGPDPRPVRRIPPGRDVPA